MTFSVTKTYGHDLGLSVSFRQWRSASHCSHIHGYSLAVALTFEAEDLDYCEWVLDFGSLGVVRRWLQDTFDHVLLVACDDPHRAWFEAGAAMGTAKVLVVNATGCEAFSRMVGEHVSAWLRVEGHAPRVRLSEVRISEHAGNSASFKPDA